MSALLVVLGATYLISVTLWTSGALYFDAGRGSVWGWFYVAAWNVLVICSVLFLQPFFVAVLFVTIAFAAVLVWWFRQKPRNDRDWSPNFSQPCRISIDGDQVAVDNVRNSKYRTSTDYDLHYETRQYKLSELKAVDVLILFWGSEWISHPMVIFDFGQNQHLCFSVEVRYQQGQPYSVLRSFYRQYELMHVVSDERDAILLRTKCAENHDCYLYRLQGELASVHQLFLEYVNATNDLADTPRWYHAVTDNCTTSVMKIRAKKVDLDVRIFINGALDKLLYERGRLNRRIPFETLKEQSWINERANHAAAHEFSAAIRKDLPGFGSE